MPPLVLKVKSIVYKKQPNNYSQLPEYSSYKNLIPTKLNIYTQINNNIIVRSKAFLGYHTELIICFNVGYRIIISVRWKLKKKGCTVTPIIARAPYAI